MDIKSNREKKIDNFIDNLFDNNKFEHKKKKKIDLFYEKFKEELEDYNFIDSKHYSNIKLGGYIRYIDLNDELRWGGILLKKYKYKDMNMMLLCNSNFKNFSISFDKNVIFYKKHTTQTDKTRKLFLSYLDKY